MVGWTSFACGKEGISHWRAIYLFKARQLLVIEKETSSRKVSQSHTSIPFLVSGIS